jgi:Flp pilus assembly protein TadG
MKTPRKLRRGRRGQALLLVTLSLFAMCGLLGLAVDLGWSYFVKKSAQNAADSAALAEAYQALANGGETAASFSGDPTVAAGYASQNLFAQGGNSGRQIVTVTPITGTVTRLDGTTVQSCGTNPSVVGCVDYAVTVRTGETIPQLFSAVLGNTTALSSARATAGIVRARVNGSVIALDRTADAGPSPAGMTITAPSGLVVASSQVGVSQVNGPIIGLYPMANPGVGGSNTFQTMVDGPQFLDPLRGYGQPLLTSSTLNVYAVISGTLSGAIYQVQGDKVIGVLTPGGGTTILPSGIYFPAQCTSQCTSNPIGAIAPLAGGLSIGPGATVMFTNGAFGDFYFFGGLSVSGQMQMGPGEYVVVGGGSLQVIGKNAGITNAGSAGAGEIIILTGSSSAFTFNSDGSAITGNANKDLYPGLISVINGSNNSNLALVQMAALNGALAFGAANIQVSLGNVASANPSGLDPSVLSTLASPYPSSLQYFPGIALWQDQANSSVQYNPQGNIACAGSANNPCPRSLANPNSPQLTLPGAPLGINGTIYQPRGAWINISSGAPLSGTLQIITGGVSGGGTINILSPPTIPLRRRIVALIE